MFHHSSLTITLQLLPSQGVKQYACRAQYWSRCRDSHALSAMLLFSSMLSLKIMRSYQWPNALCNLATLFTNFVPIKFTRTNRVFGAMKIMPIMVWVERKKVTNRKSHQNFSSHTEEKCREIESRAKAAHAHIRHPLRIYRRRLAQQRKNIRNKENGFFGCLCRLAVVTLVIFFYFGNVLNDWKPRFLAERFRHMTTKYDKCLFAFISVNYYISLARFLRVNTYALVGPTCIDFLGQFYGVAYKSNSQCVTMPVFCTRHIREVFLQQ